MTNIKVKNGNFYIADELISNRNIYKSFNMNDNEQISYSNNKSKYNKQFGCLFVDNIDLLYNVGNAGFMVFLYICKNIEFNCNYIILKQQDIAKKLNVSHPLIGRGIQALLDTNVIQKDKKTPFCYIINHNIYFKGDIVKLINKLKEHGQKCKM